jgi:hypothetical protein
MGFCLQDGTQVQFRSVVLNRYISAANGDGSNVTVDRDVASTWETFRVGNLTYWLVFYMVICLCLFRSCSRVPSLTKE